MKNIDLPDVVRNIDKDRLVHVLPVNDMHAHTESGFSCLCRPKIMLVNEGNGAVVIHNSWDGRELKEQNKPIN